MVRSRNCLQHLIADEKLVNLAVEAVEEIGEHANAKDLFAQVTHL